MNLAINLTILGLAPFIFFLSVIIFDAVYFEWLADFVFKGDFSDFLLNYAVVILSFLAGISWGLEIKPNNQKKKANNIVFYNAVFITISAVLAMMFYSIKLAYLYLSFCYLWQLFIDLKVNNFYKINPGYIKIRKFATTVVVLVLLLAVYFVESY
ncbi:MAG: DUF3429 family protein [Rickettsiales bacterium]|nr:DUF3429 family protein [Rickettsiales bacterium]